MEGSNVTLRRVCEVFLSCFSNSVNQEAYCEYGKIPGYLVSAFKKLKEQIKLVSTLTLRFNSTNEGIPDNVEYSFLSDSDECYRCLEDNLKAGYFGQLFDLHNVNHVGDVASIKSRYENVLRNTPLDLRDKVKTTLLRSTLGNRVLPTRFDRPDVYMILERLIEDLKISAKLNKIDVSKFPKYAVLPTGKVNALAIKLDCCDEPFLLFDSQLFIFCHLFSKAFVEIITGQCNSNGDLEIILNEKPLLEKLITNQEGVSRLIDLLHSYVVHGDPSRAGPYLPRPEIEHLISIVRDGMELFVVGHEFAHVVHGHLDSGFLRVLHEELKPGLNISDKHLKEFQADFLGISFMANVIYKRFPDPAFSVLGAYLFFVSLEYCDKLNYFFLNHRFDGYEDLGSETHPSFKERKAFVKLTSKYIFKGKVSERSLKVLDDIEGPVIAIQKLMEAFFTEEFLKSKS